MHRRSLGRATTLALAGVLAAAGIASADSVLTDGDAVASGNQGTVHIGVVAPGAVVTVDVAFELRCSTLNHVDPGQTVTMGLMGSMAAPGGAVLSVSTGTVGPTPGDWPVDGAACPSPAPTVATHVPSVVTLRAPTAPNVNYTYTIGYTRTVFPAGGTDGSAVAQAPSIVIRLDVADNTPPVVTVPDDQTVEGDTTGGWTAAYPGVSAADAQDDPDPVATCAPAAGTVLPLGPTTVTCEATDSGGLTDSDAFVVTVVDTTAPVITGQADIEVSTADPTGSVVDYGAPTATDVVDAAVTVDCLPASGGTFPVGTTTVTCSAADDSGNSTSTTFGVTVTHVPSHTASAAWGEPIAVGDGGTFAANRGRNLPIKVTLAVDGVVRTSGSADLSLVPCGGGSATTLPLTYSGGRWNAALDTGPLAGSCHVVTASIDGLTAGWFQLELRGAEPTKAKGQRK